VIGVGQVKTCPVFLVFDDQRHRELCAADIEDVLRLKEAVVISE
jgi:hypothetical protein